MYISEVGYKWKTCCRVKQNQSNNIHFKLMFLISAIEVVVKSMKYIVVFPGELIKIS